MNTESMKNARTLAELKRAYRKLAFENHPDRGGSEDAMKEINEVFRIHFERFKNVTLSDSDKEDFGTARNAREYTDFVYNEYRWEGSRYDRNLTLSDICKKIKEYGAMRFPTCKFSVHKDGYSSIYIALMSGDFEAHRETAGYSGRSFNHHHPEINNEFTDRCIEVLRLMSEYAQSYNYDNSDIMTDYFDVNFYLTVTVGKFNKEYVNTSKLIGGEKLKKTATEKELQKLFGANNWVYKTTVAKTEGYYICTRGDNPYANYYSQYSRVKTILEKLANAGIKAVKFGHAIKIENWDEIEAKIEREKKELTEKPEPKAEAASPVKCGEIKIIDYSERAIAVIGDTKPIKGMLKSAGGRFNKFLSCGCGWVFSKNKRNEVESIINSVK
jgi:hypothetical protein